MYAKPSKKKRPSVKKPTASLDIEGYYSCSREEAKELFQPFILLDGMYLVRPSESQGALYTLSVTKDRKVYNYRIQQEEKTKLFLIQDRTEKFGNVPLLIQAYKEKPVNPQLNVKLVAPLVQGTKRKQNSQAFLNNYSKTHETAMDDIPGLHRYLPRSEIKNVMEAYLHRPGTFLLRPSLTTEGSLTLTVVHKYELLHFKITQNPNTKEVCVASKKFANFSELLDFYKYNPLKIRSRPNDNILLTFPLPVDKHLENIHKQAQDELYSELAGVQPLPEGWTEHFDETRQKNYYHNSATNETKWSKPLPAPPPPPSRTPSASSNVASSGPALPARRSLHLSKSAPVLPPPRRDTFNALPTSSTIIEDSTYIECGDLPVPSASDVDEDNYIAVESPTSKLPPMPEDDAHPQLRRVTSAPTAGKAPIGAKRMSVIKGDKRTIKEEKELMKQQKQEDRKRLLKEKEEKKEAAKKAKEEAKRLKAEEAQRKKQQKEELKRQKEEEKKKVKEERLQRTLSLSGPPKENEEQLHRTYTYSPSKNSGPPSPPLHVDLDPTASQTSPLTSPPKPGPPPPPPRVDLDPTFIQTSPLTSPPKPGPPPPPPRVDLDPTLGQNSPPSGSGPPPAPPPPPPLTGTAAQTTEIKDDKQVEKERKVAEKLKKQEEERLKKEAAKREKEEAKRKKEEEKRERRMSKSKSATKSVAVEPTPVTEEQATSKGNVPPPPPPPPIGGPRPLQQCSATTDPVPMSSSPINLPPSAVSIPAPPPLLAASVSAPPPPPAASKPPPSPPASVPAPPPLPPVSVPAPPPPPAAMKLPPAASAPPPPPAAMKPPPAASVPAPPPAASVPAPPPPPASMKPPPVASAPAPPPPPPINAPAPPPPISPPPTASNPTSPTSSGFSADDLIAGKNRLTTAALTEKPTQPPRAGGLGGLMQSAFDQFNDKIGAMRSFVEYSDDEDFEELEEDEDWD